MNDIVQAGDTPVDQIAGMPRDLAILKMENESMMSLAAAHPRNHAMILKDIKDQLQTYKSFAQAAIYRKPVGRDGGGPMRYATGLSVRAAEALAEAYGHNRVRLDMSPVDVDTVRIEATFTDYQKGRQWSSASLVSKNYTGKGGRRMRWNDDRYYNVVLKAEGSKLVREVILRSVPPGLRSELETCIEEQVAEFLDDSTTAKIIAQFSQKNVSEVMLCDMLGKRRDSWTKQDRATLLGLWNAIEQGETTVAEAFGDTASDEPAATTSRTEALKKRLQPGADASKTEAKPQPKDDGPPPPSQNDVPPEQAATEPTPVDALVTLLATKSGKPEIECLAALDDKAGRLYGKALSELTPEQIKSLDGYIKSGGIKV